MGGAKTPTTAAPTTRQRVPTPRVGGGPTTRLAVSVRRLEVPTPKRAPPSLSVRLRPRRPRLRKRHTSRGHTPTRRIPAAKPVADGRLSIPQTATAQTREPVPPTASTAPPSGPLGVPRLPRSPPRRREPLRLKGARTPRLGVPPPRQFVAITTLRQAPPFLAPLRVIVGKALRAGWAMLVVAGGARPA